MNKFTVGAIAVLLLIFGGLIYYTTKGSDTIDYSKYDPNTIIEGTKDNGNIDEHIRGKTDSSVILIEYADLQCPGCAASYPGVEELYEGYGDRVAFVFRNFPISAHKNARAASAAAESAGFQGHYWEMLSKLYSDRAAWLDLTGGERTQAFASIFQAVAPDGDVDKFKSDMSSEKIEAKITFDYTLGKDRAGVTATPSFFVNGKAVDLSEVSTQDDLKNAVSKALDEALKENGLEVGAKKSSKDKE